MSDKIPCGDKPKRYPRTNFKKYQDSPIWNNLGKKDEIEPRRERVFNGSIVINCPCGNKIKTKTLPVSCEKCRITIKARKKKR